jgi:cobalt-zinc-cadmium efflux system protein
MSGPHDHGDGHAHAQSSELRVLLTFSLITVFMVVEAAGGLWSGSLTLLADAGHMLTDSAALALALVAQRAMRKPTDALMSYGRDRFSVLAALVNGLGLIAIVGWIAIEAIRRLVAPEPVLAIPMLAIAIAGLAVNSGAFFLLHGADRDNLNIHAALLHVLGDILASLAAVVAALVILVTGWTPADPILSTIAGALILRNAVSLVRRSWHVLMESTPEGVDAEEIEHSLEALDGVADIHHLHAWSLVPGKPLITLHARVEIGHEPDEVLARIKQELVARYGIDHSTIQMERSCPDPVEHHDDGHGHDHDHAGDHHDHGHRMAAS